MANGDKTFQAGFCKCSKVLLPSTAADRAFVNLNRHRHSLHKVFAPFPVFSGTTSFGEHWEDILPCDGFLYKNPTLIAYVFDDSVDAIACCIAINNGLRHCEYGGVNNDCIPVRSSRRSLTNIRVWRLFLLPMKVDRSLCLRFKRVPRSVVP